MKFVAEYDSMSYLKPFFHFILLLTVVGLAFGMGAFFFIARDLPSADAIIARQISETTKIYDRTGQTILYNVHGEEKRTIIPWENIPPTIKQATLAAEDSSFYDHGGLDFKGILRSFFKNVSSFEISQGGSTITQQLIKKALLGDQRQSFYSISSRKIKEAVLAMEIERKFSKDQIFWMYLNQIPYGSNAYGIESASQTFFGRPAKDLTLSQAALLASLSKAPSYYSPYGNHLPEILARKDNTLLRMKNLGYITPEEHETAIKEKLEFKPPRENISAPHFVLMVKDYLSKKYGEEMVQNGGLKIITTLDYSLQTIAEEAIAKQAGKNEKLYKANNAALTAVNPRTGQILAMVGSRDYFDIDKEGNFNVALAKRQPGSAFKPFAYATAIEKGFPDSTILFDYPTEFNPYCSPNSLGKKDQYGLDCYHPGNYDGGFRGPVTMRQALAQSLNIPSVQILYLAGIDQTIDLAERTGISTLQENRSNFGLSLVLGGAEVKLLDIVSAYGVFANDGLRQIPAFILRVEDGAGNILEEYKPKEERVLAQQTARMITSLLSDNRARSPVFGPNSSLYFRDRPVAAKTGTTQENRDAWVVGYTPSLSVGVWVGNNDNQSMTRQGAGISASGPIWHDFMAKALQDQPVEEFLPADPVEVDKIMLNGSYLVEKTIPKTTEGSEIINIENPNSTPDPATPAPKEAHSVLYYVNKEDPLGPFPSNPEDDLQFKNWEWAVRNHWN
ncbi:MAG: hypothetical protein A3C71_00375 [Candidatus Yanofskybacteria bacterium RIFCSPHIGHO2_02_FULL_43_15c]|uniref:Uncharacterized protein n=1 Tax=Candidatus Yanofskybacteria bacterium RIFCSPHIGHO2_02_FULL_43_15c TaxID=1802679 RepID=A0A1F8FIW9_9BACT|nr:MAG: hypothetical protein A3C71_00375 [Candidatus Yanofskybacteria bacterium RIFCSPHIGHO2_02_FULL_43_15c]